MLITPPPPVRDAPTPLARSRRLAPLRFVLVGVLCAALDLGVTHLLLQWALPAWLAASAGFAAGLVANFWGHATWTFQTRLQWRSAWRFAAVVLLNYLLMLLCVLLAQHLANAPLWGKLLALPLVALLGYTLSRRWVFA